MKIVTFAPRHLDRIKLVREIDAAVMAPVLADPNYALTLATMGPAWTVLDDEDTPIACLGLMKQWEGRAITWAFMSSATRYYMTAITRATRSVLDTAEFYRIEAAVDYQFTEAIRWVELLGFKRECLMTAYSPNRRDAYLYARIQGV